MSVRPAHAVRLRLNNQREGNRARGGRPALRAAERHLLLCPMALHILGNQSNACCSPERNLKGQTGQGAEGPREHPALWKCQQGLPVPDRLLSL